MKSSFFKEAIRLQFNALMMLTIKGTLKQKRKQLSNDPDMKYYSVK